jgi:hypothetical protein
MPFTRLQAIAAREHRALLADQIAFATVLLLVTALIASLLR